MSDDYFLRGQLVMTRIQRIQLEAEAAADVGDVERLRQLQDEIQVLVGSMLDIREEQLLDMLERQGRKSWWRRLLRLPPPRLRQ